MTKRSMQLVAGLFMALMFVGPSTAAAADNWIGVWALNPAKSTFRPGPPNKEWTLAFERTADGSIKLTSTGVTGTGQKQSMSFTSKFDGAEVAWTGNPDADAAAPLRMSDNVYVNIAKKGGKLVQTVRVEVSADGKTMTVTQTGTVNNLVVYERKK